MQIRTFSNGLLGSNTYLVWDEDSREAMVIDCGNAPRETAKTCEKQGLKLKYIALTHGHYDHADYVELYKASFPKAQLVCHADEVRVLTDPEANVSMLLGLIRSYPAPDLTVDEEVTLTLGGLTFKVIHTPGHTPGSICLYCESEKTLFTGDTLFVGGYGRTDFKYGSLADLTASLRRLTALPEDTEFYSGHGEAGRLCRERKY